MGSVSCRNGFRNKNMEGQGLEVRGRVGGRPGGWPQSAEGAGKTGAAGWGCLLTGTVA